MSLRYCPDMRFTTAVMAGIVLGGALLIGGASLSLCLVPPGPISSLKGVAIVEKLVSFQSYLMLPALSAGVGLVASVLGVRWRGLAGTVAVLPVVAVFVSANAVSIWLAVIFVALAWLAAQAAGSVLQTVGSPDPASPRKASPWGGRRMRSSWSKRLH